MFAHPSALPIAEIDRSFANAVPICTELNTPVGPIDALYATPEGKLVILETKLWRNPQARREVVGQILDYAKELSRWAYEDLQREVSRRTGRSGNALYEIVADTAMDLDEADFVDELSRSLRQGRFLLLICGDGIREGVAAITDFLEQHGTLRFTFGLVEVAVYDMPEGRRLVQPRVLAQSLIAKRTVVSLESEGLVAADDNDNDDPERELSDLEKFYRYFWREFIGDLELDDPDQPPPKETKVGNVFLQMPKGANAWITLYFYQKDNRAGVFLTFTRGNLADRIFEHLSKDKVRIEAELGIPVSWDSEKGKHSVSSGKNFPNLRDPIYRTEIKTFLADRSNRFVNVFRHRIERIVEEI